VLRVAHGSGRRSAAGRRTRRARRARPAGQRGRAGLLALPRNRTRRARRACRARPWLRGRAQGRARARAAACRRRARSTACRAPRALQRLLPGHARDVAEMVQGPAWLAAGWQPWHVPHTCTCKQLPMCGRAKGQSPSGCRCLDCGARRAPAMQRFSRAAAHPSARTTRCSRGEPRLAAGVGVAPELHALAAHQAVQRDEYQVQAVHAALERVAPLLVRRRRRAHVLLRPHRALAATAERRCPQPQPAPGTGARDPPCARHHARLALSCTCLILYLWETYFFITSAARMRHLHR